MREATRYPTDSTANVGTIGSRPLLSAMPARVPRMSARLATDSPLAVMSAWWGGVGGRGWLVALWWGAGLMDGRWEWGWVG
jgi:hypothetical protein